MRLNAFYHKHGYKYPLPGNALGEVLVISQLNIWVKTRLPGFGFPVAKQQSRPQLRAVRILTVAIVS